MDAFDLVAKLKLDSSGYEEGLGDAETKGLTFGRGLKKAAVVGAGAVAAVGTAAIAAGTALAKGTGDVAAYGDNIDKMSQKMGISARAYQEWDAIMQHSGTSIDSMSRGMQTLQRNAVNSADKFEKLGISQEQLASMSTEDLFSATITGLQNMGEGAERTALASELLGGSAKELGALLNTSAEDTQAMRDRVHELGGVMSDDAVKAAAAYQDSLQDMRTGFDSLKRNMLSEFLPTITSVMDGLTNLFTGDYDEGIERISEGVGQAIDKFSEMLPKIGNAIIQNLPVIIQTGIQVVKGFISGMGQAMPQIISTAGQSISTLVQGFAQNFPRVVAEGMEVVSNIANGIVEGLPKVAEQGVQIITTLAEGISQNLPQIVETVVHVVSQLITTIAENLPLIIAAGVQVLQALVEGIANSIPEMIGTVITVIEAIGETIVENLPTIIESGLELLLALAQGIADNLPEMTDTIIEVITQIITVIIEHLPEIIEVGVEILIALGKGLIDTIPVLVADIPQIIDAIKNAFLDIDWGAVGSNIIDGIKNGISSAAGRIADAAREAARKALDAAKDFLGIHSPSTVFRDQIGKYMALGMAEGFEDNIPVDDMQNSLDGMVNGLSTTKVKGNNGNVVSTSDNYTFNIYQREGENDTEFARRIADIINSDVQRKRAVYA